MKSLLVVGGNSSVSISFIQNYAKSYQIDVIVHSDVRDEIKHLVENIFYCDFTLEGSVDNLIIENKYAGVVFLQGIDIIKPFFMLSETELINSFKINVLSTVTIIKKLYKERTLVKNASIVLMSSISGGIKGTAGHFAYSATKSSITGVVKTLSIELARRNIRINSISAALIGSSNLEEVNRELMTDDEFEIYQKKYPLGLVKMDSIIKSIHFLLSEDSMSISGSDLLVDSAHTKL